MTNGLTVKMVIAVLGIVGGVVGIITGINDVITTKQEMNEAKENN
jgi:hypothetical protein